MKRFTRLIICLFVLILSLSLLLPVAVAQEPTPTALPQGWVAFAPEGEILSIVHPANLFAGLEGESSAHLVVANSAALLERLINADDTDDAALPGDQAIQITVIPVELLGMLGTGATAESTAEELLLAFETMQQMPTVAIAWEYGEMAVAEVGGKEFGVQQVAIPDQSMEGYLVTTQSEGIVMYVVIGTYTGEFTEEWFNTALTVVDTLTVSATPEELLAIWTGEAAATPTAPDGTIIEATATPGN